MNPFLRIGRPVCLTADYLGDLFSLSGRTVLALLDRRQPGRRVVRRTTLMQFYFTGVQGLPTVLLLSALLGLSLAAVIPQKDLLVTFLAKGYVPFLASYLAALVILARSTTAITVELGNMTVGHEIDLLESMGIEPDFHVVVPRVAGVLFAAAGLAIAAAFSAPIAAGVFIAVRDGTAPADLWRSVANGITARDLGAAGLKALMFGGILVFTGLREGLCLLPLTTEVPKAVSKSVIRALLLLSIAEVFLLLARYA